MKAILIDDEQHNVDNLQALLRLYCPQVTVCATAQDAESGKTLLYRHQPDLVFLDIQMPEQTGFDLLRSLPTYDFELIVVTAYDQYALQAMRFAAVDYLLKPVDIGELQVAVDRAMKQRRLKVQNQQLENLVQLLRAQQENEAQRIALPTAKEIRLVNVADITHCESANNYTTFFLNTQEKLLVCKPIYEYDELLTPHGFLRCHQSHLVNKKWIKSWRKDVGDFLVLTDGAEVPVSRGKKDAVKLALNLT